MKRIRRTAATVEDQKRMHEEAEIPEDDDEALDENEVAETHEDMDRIEAKYRARATSPLRAIRTFCVLCMGCQPKMVAKCSAPKCPLYPFRMGKNPFQKHSKDSKTRRTRS